MGTCQDQAVPSCSCRLCGLALQMGRDFCRGQAVNVQNAQVLCRRWSRLSQSVQGASVSAWARELQRQVLKHHSGFANVGTDRQTTEKLAVRFTILSRIWIAPGLDCHTGLDPHCPQSRVHNRTGLKNSGLNCLFATGVRNWLLQFTCLAIGGPKKASFSK